MYPLINVFRHNSELSEIVNPRYKSDATGLVLGTRGKNDPDRIKVARYRVHEPCRLFFRLQPPRERASLPIRPRRKQSSTYVQ